MACWQVLLFPYSSTATQVRVATDVLGSMRLVVVLSTRTDTVPQLSLATGRSKVQASPCDTVRPGWHTIVGAVVSLTVIRWTQVLRLPQSSVAAQVRSNTLTVRPGRTG